MFPNILWGPDGEQYHKYTVQQNGWPLGTLLNLPDGRKYRFFKNGATLAVAGDLNTSVLPVANHVNMAVAATAIGASSVAVTLGSSTTAAALYDDGYLSIDVSPGQGYSYKLATGQPASVSTALTVNLAPGNTIQVALVAATTKATLTKNPFDSNIIAATTPGAPVVGAPASAVAASGFGWMQTAGSASILTDGTVVAGNIVVPSSGTAGAAMAATTDLLQPVGVVQRLGATTAQSVVKLSFLE